MVGNFGCACVGSNASSEGGFSVVDVSGLLQPANSVAASATTNKFKTFTASICRSAARLSTQLRGGAIDRQQIASGRKPVGSVGVRLSLLKRSFLSVKFASTIVSGGFDLNVGSLILLAL